MVVQRLNTLKKEKNNIEALVVKMIEIFHDNPIIKLKYNYEDIREYLKVKL